MKEIKFRYIFQNVLFKDISIYYFTLEEIEKGAVEKVLKSGMLENGYKLIARNLFTGFYDEKKKEIYEEDIFKSKSWTIFLRGYKRDDDTILIRVGWFKTKWVGCIIGERFGTYDLGEFLNTCSSLNNIGEIIGNPYENPELLNT